MINKEVTILEITKILEILKSEGMSQIEELQTKDDIKAVRFSYDFDEDEIEAAKAYANDECDEDEDEEEGEIWYEEYFLPYLNDLAVDNVGDIIEDIMSDYKVGAQYVSYELDEEQYESNEFIAIFYDKDKNVDIEDVLQEMEL